MGDRQSSGSVVDTSTIDESRSGFKTTGEKRLNADLEDKSLELTCKRTKMGDLESVLHSKGMENCNSESLGCEPTKNQHFCKNKAVPVITEESQAMVPNTLQAQTTGQHTVSHLHEASCLSSHCVNSDPNPKDLKIKPHPANADTGDVSTKKDRDHNPTFASSRGVGLDLNTDDNSNSAVQNPFYPYKVLGNVKSTAASECGSSTGPLEENESYRWRKEMKQNGFLSSAHGGIPMPTQSQPPPHPHRSRKKKTDPLKKKMELAKREQVHRFTMIAAPSGLLNGLNPGIINHVRNSKQVHSIIEALVKSEKHENRLQSRSAGHLKGGLDSDENIKNPEKIHDSGDFSTAAHLKAEHANASSGYMQRMDYPVSSSMLMAAHKAGCGNSEILERRFYDDHSEGLHIPSDCEDEMLTHKLSSSITTASENFSASNVESASHSSVSSLSAKAATVASQWLELLYQDIRGRLAALRRSKKRVQAVIQTELPFLIMKEFPSTRENDHCFRQSPSVRNSNTVVADMHRARWTALIDQMEKVLAEEGKHLETWLDQVKDMQLQCGQGLQCVNLHSLQSLGRSQSVPRSKMETQERELAVRAAAASIYSTCNFVKATGDISCFRLPHTVHQS